MFPISEPWYDLAIFGVAPFVQDVIVPKSGEHTKLVNVRGIAKDCKTRWIVAECVFTEEMWHDQSSCDSADMAYDG